MDDVESTLKQRNLEYGNSWLSANKAVEGFTEGHSERLQLLMEAGHLQNWSIIVNKLARAMASPGNPDHWRDIAGYAKLSQALAQGEEDKYLPLNQPAYTVTQTSVDKPKGLYNPGDEALGMVLRDGEVKRVVREGS